MKWNPISLTGIAIATLSALFFIFTFLADLFGLHTNPYLGIVFFLVVPAIFVIGLLMIPAGIIMARRRRAKGLEPQTWPTVDLNQPRHRRIALTVLSLTIVNLLIVSLAAYKGMEYMDSPSFCGQVCHTPMHPEYTAYLQGPHANVECVHCHVGNAPGSFIRAKLNGLHQVYSLATGTFPRPVPSPVWNMRPANETCEQCHWPEKFHGDKLRVVHQFADDEQNTDSVTTLTVHVGGGSAKLGIASGIHWHMNVNNDVEYVSTDAKRETIPYVRVTDAQGNVREYRAPDVTDDVIAKGEHRRMDCIDCHNRPAHAFSSSPEHAVDAAMTTGEIPRTLPFAHREAVAALKTEYPDSAAAADQIAQRLRAFYTQNYAALTKERGADIDQLVRGAQNVYGRNVFPVMKVTWGTHLSNLGHTDANGCFRCHDDQHKSADGKVIKQDCDTCHTMPE
jgi:hypothetical protein